MSQRIPLMIIPIGIAKKLSRIFFGMGGRLSRLVPGIKYDLQETDLGIAEEEYMAYSILNSFFIFIIFFGLLFLLSYRVKENSLQYSLVLSLALSFCFAIVFLVLLVRYPKITAGKKAEQIDKNLIFALKDLYLQINSGISLYNAMVNIAKEDYGQISIEFGKVAKSVNTGTPVVAALEKMVLKSKSEYLRRTIWQIINTLKAGASLSGALRTIIDDLTIDQKSKIRDYAHELNLWSLIYMLFAVAVPTIGATMLVILTSFAGFGITKGMFVIFIILCFIVQVILIGFVKTRRPLVHI